jgi:hypothetical protein
MKWILAACLMLFLTAPTAAQCYDRPAWHGSGYNWNGGYYEPWYTYHYRSYRSWSYRRYEWD